MRLEQEDFKIKLGMEYMKRPRAIENSRFGEHKLLGIQDFKRNKKESRKMIKRTKLMKYISVSE